MNDSTHDSTDAGLSSEALARLGERLSARHASLQQQIIDQESRVEDYSTRDDEVHDFKDNAAEEQNAEKRRTLLFHWRAEFNAVSAALERVANGSYGTCVRCGEPIPLARLEAQPEAVRCIDCEAAVSEQ